MPASDLTSDDRCPACGGVLHWARRRDDDPGAFETWACSPRGLGRGEWRQGVAFCPYGACASPLVVDVMRVWASSGVAHDDKGVTPFGLTEAPWVERVRISAFAPFDRRRALGGARQAAAYLAVSPLIAALGGPVVFERFPLVMPFSLLASAVVACLWVSEFATICRNASAGFFWPNHAPLAILTLGYALALGSTLAVAFAALRVRRARRRALARRAAERRPYVEFAAAFAGSYRSPA